MSTACTTCGSALAEGQAFCANCGTRRAESTSAQASKFCTGCGAPMPAGVKFCEKCGASAGTQTTAGATPTAAPSNTGSSQLQPTAGNPAPAPGGKSGSTFLKVAMIAVALFVFVLLLGMGSCAYIAYRAKQRFDRAQKAYKNDDLAGMVAAATGKTAKPQPLPNWRPAPAELISSPASKIPLRKSLRIVDSGTDELRGDFESIFIIDNVTDQLVHIRASQQYPNGDGLERFLNGGTSDKQKVRKIDCGRTVFTTDMENSAEADGYVCREGRDEKHPGTTTLGLSRKVFNQLKTAGEAEYTYHEDPLKALLKSFKKAMSSDSASSDAASQDLIKKMMNFAPSGGFTSDSSAMDTPPLKCTLRRSGNDVAFPVIVNDQPTELPVMDVRVRLPDREGHFYVLDDPDNPLVLAAASTAGGRVQVIKIYWDVEQNAAPNQLENELEKDGRATVYNLYFDFASDTLRPESDKVIKEIAYVMHAHPNWKLSVEGHTDNIGGDKSNLELSKHRAAAVVGALAAGYGIPETRFRTAGFGASRPVDTNETPEGRAKNRRVELVRQ